MAKVWFGAQTTPSRYEALTQQRERRRAIMEHGMSRSDSMRNFQSANIAKSTSLQVQTTEMQLRATAQAAAKAKLAKLTALQNKVNKTV